MDIAAWKEWLEPALVSAETQRALTPGASVAVYGAGTVAAEAVGILRSRGVNVVMVIDGNTTRREVAGLAVQRPDDASISPAQRAATTLLIAIFNGEVDIARLSSSLRKQGWTRQIDFCEVHAMWPKAWGDRYWLTTRDFYGRHTAPIAEVDALWADETSRDLYRRTLKFRVTGLRDHLVEPDTKSQYFPTDLPGWKTPLRMIDCGAFDGDTVRFVAKLALPVEEMAVFEPEPANYAKLAETVRQLPPGSFAVSAWPCGVWKKTEPLRFNTGSGPSSSLKETGEKMIQCVALDDALPHFRPTLIKMDIEGVEAEALEGARRLIATSGTGLAICLYHHPEDLWKLPLLVRSLGADYRLYLRCHLYSGFELVLYALRD